MRNKSVSRSSSISDFETADEGSDSDFDELFAMSSVRDVESGSKASKTSDKSTKKHPKMIKSKEEFNLDDGGIFAMSICRDIEKLSRKSKASATTETDSLKGSGDSNDSRRKGLTRRRSSGSLSRRRSSSRGSLSVSLHSDSSLTKRRSGGDLDSRSLHSAHDHTRKGGLTKRRSSSSLQDFNTNDGDYIRKSARDLLADVDRASSSRTMKQSKRGGTSIFPKRSNSNRSMSRSSTHNRDPSLDRRRLSQSSHSRTSSRDPTRRQRSTRDLIKDSISLHADNYIRKSDRSLDDNAEEFGEDEALAVEPYIRTKARSLLGDAGAKPTSTRTRTTSNAAPTTKISDPINHTSVKKDNTGSSSNAPEPSIRTRARDLLANIASPVPRATRKPLIQARAIASLAGIEVPSSPVVAAPSGTRNLLGDIEAPTSPLSVASTEVNPPVSTRNPLEDDRQRLIAATPKVHSSHRSMESIRKTARALFLSPRVESIRKNAREALMPDMQALRKGAQEFLADDDSSSSMNEVPVSLKKNQAQESHFQADFWKKRSDEFLFMDGPKNKSLWEDFEDEPEDSFTRRWNKANNASCIVLVLGGVLSAAIAVGTVFAMGHMTNSSGYTSNLRPTLPPSPHTESVGTDWQRPSVDAYGPKYIEMVDKLAPLFPNGQQEIPYSREQQNALLWLTFEDPHPAVVLYELSPSQLLERFVLKLLHNTTADEEGSWVDLSQFLIPSSICEWGDGRLIQLKCNTQSRMLETLHIDTSESPSMQGNIPTELALLSQLTSLTITNNKNLTGSIPSELSTLGHLTMLKLSQNQQLGGSIPETFGYLSNLKLLYLNSNALEGTIPSELRQMQKMEQLWLQHNKLTGTVPEELFELPYLETIRVEGNLLDDCPANATGIVTCDCKV